MAEGGREAVRVDDEVIGAAKVRQLEEHIRELESVIFRQDVHALKAGGGHWRRVERQLPVDRR
jgi:hypothetical protein